MLKKLKSCDKNSICEAAYYFGEQRDKDVTKDLLTGIDDPRITHLLQYYGMSVYYCKMVALNKISGLDIKVEKFSKPDSTKIGKFINWAVANGLVNREEKIDTRSCLDK